MMALEYPRVWYGVGVRFGDIREQTFTGETAQKLKWKDRIGGQRYTDKSSRYEVWFANRADAEQCAQSIKDREDEVARLRLIQKAAPELLEALEKFRDYVVEMQSTQGTMSHHDPIWSQVAEALAKAKGETP